MKNKNVLNEINEMKYLFGYQRGKVMSEQYNLYEADEIGQPTDVSGSTSGSTSASTVTNKTTRKSTGLEVQKLLNTKFSAGLKEDGKVGPLTLGATMNALEGLSGGSTSGTATSGTTATSGGGSGSEEIDSLNP